MPWANSDDSLQHFSHAAAETLRRAQESIMIAWEADAKQYVLHGQDLPADMQLRNSLPKLLGNLAASLEDPHWTYRERLNMDIARHHGAQRHHLGRYTLEQMIDEYAILRKAVVGAMQQKQPWPSSIMARIHAFLDASIRGGAVEFAARQKQSEVCEIRDELDATTEDRDAHRQLVNQLEEEKSLRARFVALLTHDLSNPLTAIRINCQRIEKRCHDPALMVHLSVRMQQAIKRMEKMIRDMLDTTRLQAGQRLPVHIERCDLAEVASHAVQEVVLADADRLHPDIPPSLVGSWDPDALRRTIDNLLGNAIKYGAAGGRISVVLKASDDGAYFSVHNFGPAIPADDLANVFDAYARAKAARAGTQQGWGLGLYLVHAVIEAHGGTVGASSDAEAGTCFWFTLPLHSPSQELG